MVAILEITTRVASLVFLGLSFIGWIVFVIGYADLVSERKKYDKGFDPGDEPDYYPFWVGSVVGPVLHILAAAHALLFPAILRGVPGSIVGSITAVLFVMYITSVGFVLVAAGISIGSEDNDDEDPEDYINLLFAGGFLTTVFMLAVLLAIYGVSASCISWIAMHSHAFINPATFASWVGFWGNVGNS